MKFEYEFRDDSREKEGDLAREGFVHCLTVHGECLDLIQLSRWCEENIKQGWKDYSISSSNSDGERVYTNVMYFKSIEEVVWTKLRWC